MYKKIHPQPQSKVYLSGQYEKNEAMTTNDVHEYGERQTFILISPLSFALFSSLFKIKLFISGSLSCVASLFSLFAWLFFPWSAAQIVIGEGMCVCDSAVSL